MSDEHHFEYAGELEDWLKTYGEALLVSARNVVQETASIGLQQGVFGSDRVEGIAATLTSLLISNMALDLSDQMGPDEAFPYLAAQSAEQIKTRYPDDPTANSHSLIARIDKRRRD